ncbi:hypothetical protein BLA29_000369 [Euroglyphus maynei]|uniref:Uncharacterized protein n=1 Tax=Euroglyphus maynei TaxID=6958 RepID=A0A1Y3BV49_EURMA|nr:hypothetical protein BLA29_000369 [Euroglyphus maynei]
MNPNMETNQARSQQPSTSYGSSNVIVGIRRKMSRNNRTFVRFLKEDWNHGPLNDWGWGYAWGYRRAQYHYMERIERCIFGRNRFYGRRTSNVTSTGGGGTTNEAPPKSSPTFSTKTSVSTSLGDGKQQQPSMLPQRQFPQRTMATAVAKSQMVETQKISTQNESTNCGVKSKDIGVVIKSKH